MLVFFSFSFFKANLGGSKQPSAAAVDVASSAAAVPAADSAAAATAPAPAPDSVAALSVLKKSDNRKSQGQFNLSEVMDMAFQSNAGVQTVKGKKNRAEVRFILFFCYMA